MPIANRVAGYMQNAVMGFSYSRLEFLRDCRDEFTQVRDGPREICTRIGTEVHKLLGKVHLTFYRLISYSAQLRT